MTRWLLNTFPTWALTAIVIGGFVLLTLIGLWVVRRAVPADGDSDHNDFAGVMAGVVAAVYGVFLAFAIVAVYEQYHEASEDVSAEAVTLALIVRDSQALPPQAEARIRAAARDYRDHVVETEFEEMRDGKAADGAAHALEDMYRYLAAYEPQGEAESAFYGEAVSALNELVAARRARIHASESVLPGLLMALLIVGAVLTVGFTLVYSVANRRMQAVLGVSLAVLMGLGVLVTVVLDQPFSGDVSVSPEPFEQGALGEL